MHRAGGVRVVVAALAVLAALGLPGAAGQDPEKAPAKAPPLDADLEPERDILKEAAGDKRNLKPDEFPPIRNPVYLGALEAPRMDNEEWVIGLVIGGKPLAYPINLLNYHEIVVDTAEGIPFLVCW